MKVYIYILRDPTTKLPRYVGKSNEFRINKRLNEHCQLNRCKANNHRNNWIKFLLTKNLRPELLIIDEANEHNFSYKEKYWVNCYKKLGFSLVNSTDGGEGIPRLKTDRIISVKQKVQISNTLKQYFSNNANKQQCSNAGIKSRGIKKKSNSSGYIGVSKSSKNKWRASIVVNWKQKHLGCFNTTIEAAQAYDKAALLYFGNNALTNFNIICQL